MNAHNTLIPTDTDVLHELDQDGPLGHDELCDRIGLGEFELQRSIRRLRNADKVVLTLDRRYDTA